MGRLVRSSIGLGPRRSEPASSVQPARAVAQRYHVRILPLPFPVIERCYVDEMTHREVLSEISKFMTEREWGQFHSPENLAKSIVIESGELLECFQWAPDADARRVREELADVLTYCFLLADRIGVDPEQIVLEKLAVTGEKYPIDTSRGRSAKYDEL